MNTGTQEHMTAEAGDASEYVPLVDLHRHLTGSIRIATILQIAQQHNIRLPYGQVDSLQAHVQTPTGVPTPVASFPKAQFVKQCFVDVGTIERVTYEVIEDAAKEGIRYLELRFSPRVMAEQHSLDLKDVTSAVCHARRVAETNLRIRSKLILIMSRQYGADLCMGELEAGLAFQDLGVVAVDLAGDEKGYPCELFAQHFRAAREAGFRITVHAGEGDGASSVAKAIEILGAERIGHGLRATEDEAVMRLIEARGIAIESCPTSNVHSQIVTDYKDHPLPAFLRRGITIALGTDNPTMYGTDIAREYAIVRREMLLTEKEVRTLKLNAVQAAFMSEPERRELLDQLPG